MKDLKALSFSSLLNIRKSSTARPRSRLVHERSPDVIYAIGDVHGELDLLLELEQRIVGDAADIDGQKLLVLLGDFIDRGARSASVLDHLLAPSPDGFERICLAGNHEVAMFQAITDPRHLKAWLKYGGDQTLLSYGMKVSELAALRASKKQARYLMECFIPDEHLTFLRDLPVSLETPTHLFVHAGITPGRSLSEMRDEELIFCGDNFLNSTLDHGRIVVHGHHIVAEASHLTNRITIDTGAYITGCLSAVRVLSDGNTSFLKVSGEEI